MADRLSPQAREGVNEIMDIFDVIRDEVDAGADRELIAAQMACAVYAGLKETTIERYMNDAAPTADPADDASKNARASHGTLGHATLS